MKTILFLVFIITMVSCNDESNPLPNEGYESTGTITGTDPRDCMCCGGWFIVIGDSTYRFDAFPKDNNIDIANLVYPFKVYLDWDKDETPCLGDEIIVTRIKKKE
jgi:hypothetical protein